jgi:hypothetical protein
MGMLGYVFCVFLLGRSEAFDLFSRWRGLALRVTTS